MNDVSLENQLIISLVKINTLQENLNDSLRCIEKLKAFISGLTPMDGYSEKLVESLAVKINERNDELAKALRDL